MSEQVLPQQESTEETTQKKRIQSTTIVGWFFGLLFLLTALSLLFTKPLAGFFYALAGLWVFPPVWNMAKKQNLKYTPPTLLKIVVFIVLIFIGGALSGANNTQSTHSNQTTAQNPTTATATNTPTPEPTEAPTVTPQPTLTTQQILAKFENDAQTVTVANIYKSPNSYKDKELIFTCSVSGFPKDENGDVGGLNCTDPNDFSSNVQVAIDKKTDVTQINQNDTIKVYGMGLGADTGKNAFGADITTGAILGLYINDLTTGYKNY